MMNSMRMFVVLCIVLALGAFSPGQERKMLVLSAIPDQDPQTLQRLYGQVAAYLSKELGVDAKFQAVPDYVQAVNGFKTGKLDLVWFGGLTGVQARQGVAGVHYIAQRDIDPKFRTVFITREDSPIRNLEDVKGRTFTFGNEWSTSGRLMPQHFLKEMGITLSGFKGKANFAATHDETYNLVAKGTYEAGAMNEQVWKRRGSGKGEGLRAFHTSMPYVDYHWLLNPESARRLGGEAFVKKMQMAFLKMQDVPGQAETLKLFGAERFVPTQKSNYDEIERIARGLELLRVEGER